MSFEKAGETMKKITMILGLALIMAAALILTAGCGGSDSGGAPADVSGEWSGTWNLVSIVTDGEEETAKELGEKVVMTLDEKGGGTYEDVAQEFTEEITWEETDDGAHIVFQEAKNEFITLDASMKDGKLCLDMDSGEEEKSEGKNLYIFEKQQ